MKLKLLIIFVLATYSVSAQTLELPRDSVSGLVVYSEVFRVPTASKEELYLRAKTWFGKTYKSATSVIQVDDKEGGIIVGKALFTVYNKSLGKLWEQGNMHYTITIQLKDGRYKQEISQFYHTGVGEIPDHGAIESMYNTKKKHMGQSFQKLFNQFIEQTDEYVKDLKSGLLVAMTQKPKDDGW